MAYKWFSAPSVTLIEGDALAAAWEVITNEIEVIDSEYVAAKTGKADSVIGTKAATYGPNLECWSEIFYGVEADFWVLEVRAEGNDTFYKFTWHGSGEWALMKEIGGTETSLASGTTETPANKNQLAIRAIGNKISCAIKKGGTVTVLANEHEDSSIATEGNVRIELGQQRSSTPGCGIYAVGAGLPEEESTQSPGFAGMIL